MSMRALVLLIGLLVIGLAVPDGTNATLSVRTYGGGFRSSF